MTSRQIIIRLIPMGILGIWVCFFAGCIISESPAIINLRTAREAIESAKQTAIDKKVLREIKTLEDRYLRARGSYYNNLETKAADMAQQVTREAVELATKRPENFSLPFTRGVALVDQPLRLRLNLPDEVNTETQVTFHASVSLDQDQLSFQWYFGDGQTSTAPRPTHSYKRPGIYLIRLDVRDSDGEIATTTQTIAVLKRRIIHFKPNRFRVRRGLANQASLQALADTLQEMLDNPTWQLNIVAHTDSIGPQAANLKMSQRRAESVQSFLAKTLKAPNRITAAWQGETQPIAPNDTKQGRFQNRRVELTLHAALERPTAVFQTSDLQDLTQIPIGAQDRVTNLYLLSKDGTVSYLPSIRQVGKIKPPTSETPSYSINLQAILPQKLSEAFADGVLRTDQVQPAIFDYIRISVPSLAYVRTYPGQVFPQLIDGARLNLTIPEPAAPGDQRKVKGELRKNKLKVQLEFLYSPLPDRKTSVIRVEQQEFLDSLTSTQRDPCFERQKIEALIPLFTEEKTLLYRELDLTLSQPISSDQLITTWFTLKDGKFCPRDNPSPLDFASISYIDFAKRISEQLEVGLNPKPLHLEPQWRSIIPTYAITLQPSQHCGPDNGVALEAMEPGQRIAIHPATGAATGFPTQLKFLNRVYQLDKPVIALHAGQPSVFLDPNYCGQLPSRVEIVVDISK